MKFDADEIVDGEEKVAPGELACAAQIAIFQQKQAIRRLKEDMIAIIKAPIYPQSALNVSKLKKLAFALFLDDKKRISVMVPTEREGAFSKRLKTFKRRLRSALFRGQMTAFDFVLAEEFQIG